MVTGYTAHAIFYLQLSLYVFLLRYITVLDNIINRLAFIATIYFKGSTIWMKGRKDKAEMSLAYFNLMSFFLHIPDCYIENFNPMYNIVGVNAV